MSTQHIGFHRRCGIYFANLYCIWFMGQNGTCLTKLSGNLLSYYYALNVLKNKQSDELNSNNIYFNVKNLALSGDFILVIAIMDNTGSLQAAQKKHY